MNIQPHNSVSLNSRAELWRTYMPAFQEVSYYLFIYSNFSSLLDPFHRNVTHSKLSHLKTEEHLTQQPSWSHTSTLDFSLSRTIVILNVSFLNIPQPTSFGLLRENGSKLGHQMTSTMNSNRIISVFILLNLSITRCSPFPKTFFPWHYPFQFFFFFPSAR